MRTITLLAIIATMVSSAFGQDIVGLEDCAKARGADQKIGCLQSNTAYLHGLIRKAEAAAHVRSREEAARLTAAAARVDALAAEIERLRVRLEKLEKPPAAK
jgi:hypothetical protein